VTGRLTTIACATWGLEDVDYAMRDLINLSKMVGPRMFVAGSVPVRRTRRRAAES
jgi:hypothetical protein